MDKKPLGMQTILDLTVKDLLGMISHKKSLITIFDHKH